MVILIVIGGDSYLWLIGEIISLIIVSSLDLYSVQVISVEGCLSNLNGVFINQEIFLQVFNN